MSAFDDFKTGDRVQHAGCGTGTVTYAGKRLVGDKKCCRPSIEVVEVEFDREGVRGQHPRDWFRIHPTTLQKLKPSTPTPGGAA